ncbi:phosphomannomutase CpsG [Endozoicomonas gorgoniicola]|uniref:phosphomannomutase n=1 Tax=Endozoicomonas gorgoniicola TaxID=1234144 RepID=A0ABT3MS54_9GAMM|nr:phosphomannomutase CpsG [Endozoicomonas gorgoniicola]MCW7552190.1 phosphomannomutase CpsG [Endozoicomonas gorgoniicola]
MTDLTCFKAYDVRGRLGEELNEDIAYRIGRAFAQHLQAKRVVVGSDVRLSSEPLKQALAKGLMDAGADVIDIGTTGTEEVYFAAFHLDVDGGIEVTASHNPIDFNGMKFVGRGAKPLSGETGLREVKTIAENQDFITPVAAGSLTKLSILDNYVRHVLGFINCNNIKPLKLVVNAGNGAAGHVIDAIESRFKKEGVPITFIKVHHEPDGHFPNGIPNPLIPEKREATSLAVKQHEADMGIAWDGDFDRCFFFDEKGEFIEGYYIVGLLAEAFLKKYPGEKIIHDPRLTWNTIDIVKKNGGIPIQSKTGHAFIKERMREENAVYGGEMSAHHYFRDFAYCDSGMIPWLLISELLSVSNKTLSEMLDSRMQVYPCSGELNYKVKDVREKLSEVMVFYKSKALHKSFDTTDGISFEYDDWRFNLRGSNTEPLLRLNVETAFNIKHLQEIVFDIENLIKG